MKNKKLIIFITLLLPLVYINTAFSYDAAVHPLITREAINKSKLAQTDYLKEELGFENGLDEQFRTYFSTNSRTVRNLIEYGSELEDEMRIGIYGRAPRHFYDPTRPPGRFTDITEFLADKCGPGGVYTSAVEWAWDRSYPDDDPYSWTDAQNYYYLALTGATKAGRDDNFANTFRALGQVAHLLEDMAVPAHVRNDNHLYGWPFGQTLYGKDLYEGYLTPQWFSVFLPVIQTAEPQNLTTFNAYWGLADYTNYNYVSDDTIFMPDFYPEHYFVYPNLGSTDFTSHEDLEISIVRAEDGIDDAVRYLKKVSDGETIDKFLAVGYFSPNLDYDASVWELELGLDDEVAYHYAEKLLPRAVSYSAGLIDYFFRGKMEVTYDPAGILTVKNKSGMVMDGTFEVYWDDETGNRSGPLISWNDNIADEEETQCPSFSLPSEAKTVFVVFSGTIGSEEAVVGKARKRYSVLAPNPSWVSSSNKLGWYNSPILLSLQLAFENAKVHWNSQSWSSYATYPYPFVLTEIQSPPRRSTWCYDVWVARLKPHVNLWSYDPNQYYAEFWFQVGKSQGSQFIFEAHNSGYEENMWYKYPENPVVGTNWTGTQYIPLVYDPPSWNQEFIQWEPVMVAHWQVLQIQVYLFSK